MSGLDRISARRSLFIQQFIFWQTLAQQHIESAGAPITGLRRRESKNQVLQAAALEPAGQPLLENRYLIS